MHCYSLCLCACPAASLPAGALAGLRHTPQPTFSTVHRTHTNPHTQLLAYPEPFCQPATLLNATAAAAGAAAGFAGNLSDGSAYPAAGYAPLSNCQWTVEAPEAPFIDVSFTRFETEPLYDTLTVEVS